MRTKALLLTAAVAAAGIVSPMAQVFSVNVVGYVSKTFSPGFQMIANPLDAEEDTVGALFGDALPNLSVVYKFNGATYDINTYRTATGWTDPDMTLAPGEGAFLRLAGSADVEVTFVGEVMQGDNGDGTGLSLAIPAGFSIRASQVPQADTVDELGLTDNLGNLDTIYQFNGTSYDIFTYRTASGWGAAGAPTVGIGESFFLRAGSATAWERDFSANN